MSSFCLPTLSTIFHSKNSPQYLRFQLPSYSLFLPNWPFSCIYLQHNSSSYTSSYSLRSPSDPACLPCAASHVGGGLDPGGWGPPWGPTRFFGPHFSYTGGWVGPTQSIGWSCFALISIRRQRLRVNQGIEKKLRSVFITWVYCVLSPGAHLLECHLCWTRWWVGTKRNETLHNIQW